MRNSISLMKHLGVVCAIAMPFFNIPLIVRVVQQKSSHNISLIWVAGVWVCIMGMLPSCLLSEDAVLRDYGIVNTIFFSVVFVVVLYYHQPKNNFHS